MRDGGRDTGGVPDGGDPHLRAAIAYPYLTPGGGSDPSARVATGSLFGALTSVDLHARPPLQEASLADLPPTPSRALKVRAHARRRRAPHHSRSPTRLLSHSLAPGRAQVSHPKHGDGDQPGRLRARRGRRHFALALHVRSPRQAR